MTTLIGLQTMLSKALPTGVDSATVLEWQLRSGKTYSQYVTEMSQALLAWVQKNVLRWGWLYSITEEQMMEYMNGDTITVAEELPDTDRAHPESYDTVGHMIDLIVYAVAIGGTKRWFKRAREAQIDAQFQRAVHRLEWRFEDLLFRRVFTDNENLIGTTGYDVGWVRTGGNVSYTPPGYDGSTFASHTHYIGVTAAQGYGTMLNNLAATLEEHGHEPPYDAIVSRTDVSSYYALPDFVAPLGGTPIVIVDQAGHTSENSFFSRETHEMGRFGGYNSEYGYINLRASNRVSTGFSALLKSYGQLDPRNPIAVRVDPDTGFGPYPVPETTTDTEYPLKQLDIEFEFGLSCGADRTAGATCYLNDGTWADMSFASESDA